MGYGTLLLLGLAVAFSIMVLVPSNPNASAAYSAVNKSVIDLQGSAINGTSGGIATGLFESVASTIKLGTGVTGLLLTLGGVFKDVFGAALDLPDMVKTFLIIVFMTMFIVASISFWLGREAG